MHWTCLPLRDGLSQFGAQWHALNTDINAAHPLLCLDFVNPLAHHFSNPHDVLAIHRTSSGVDAMVALTGSPMRWQSFRPGQAQLSPALFANSTAAASLLHDLPGAAMVLDLLCLDPLYSPALEDNVLGQTEHSTHATTMQVHIDGRFEDYWAGRVRKLQSDMQNKLNRLAADGCVFELVANETPAEVAAAFLRYAQIECLGWKGGEGTAVRLGTAQGNFFADVMTRFAARGQATVFELRINGQLAASQLVIRGGAMQVMLKTTYAESLSRYAPGLLMGYHILKHEFALRRVQQVEYYTSADHLKLRWSTAQRQIFHRRHFRHPAVRGLVHTVAQLRKMALTPITLNFGSSGA